MGIDLSGSDGRVSEQRLDHTNIHALLEYVCGKVVTQERVPSEIRVKAADVGRFDERSSSGLIREVGC
jgi:hypothetical protein